MSLTRGLQKEYFRLQHTECYDFNFEFKIPDLTDMQTILITFMGTDGSMYDNSV